MERRHQDLKAKIDAATAEIESGDYIEINGEEELREFFEDVKRRGREP